MPHIKPKRWGPICGVGIAVTAMIAAAAMTGSCVFGTTTNFCEQFGIRCTEGQECAAHQAVCIDIGGCGNGVVDQDKGEMCDDGNIVDGEVVNGMFVPDHCSHDCMSNQTCGNNQVDVGAGETCDDGDRNGLPDDGCDSNCHLKTEFCGNGIIDIKMNEQCDPGAMDSVGCNSNQANDPIHLFPGSPMAGCKFSRCGDGYTNIIAGEDCDEGMMPSATCNSPVICKKSRCGDGYYNQKSGEICDTGGDSQACNGNNNGSNGPGNCDIPRCGDSYTNLKFKPIGSTQFEKCDTGSDSPDCNGNGNGDKTNNPNAQCQPPQCGDGYVNSQFAPPGADKTETEQCDNGLDAMTGKVDDTQTCNGNNGGNNGTGSCRVPSCGDGYVNSGFTPPGANKTEECDNGVNAMTGKVDDMPACNGNNNGNNGPGSCRMPKCGDGYVNPSFKPNGTDGEQCDPGHPDSDPMKNIPPVPCSKTGESCSPSSCTCT